jgi:GntR family phosphonate transport system transcriptional regulator
MAASQADRTKGVARWRAIADALRTDVARDRFASGRLPAEPELALRFEVNRHTIRRALAALAEDGLVTIEQGRGTFVSGQHMDYALGRRTRFSANLRRLGHEPERRLLHVEAATTDAAAAAALGLRRDAKLVGVDMIGSADGVALNFAQHWFPARRFARLPEIFATTLSITEALAQCGVADYARRWTKLVARMPSVLEADRLGQPSARPVLQTESLDVDERGEPVQRSLVVWAADRVQMVIEGEAL